MGRKKRSYKRGLAFRDAKYILIVGEGKTECQYFSAFKETLPAEARRRIKLRVSEYIDDGHTQPNQLFGRALAFAQKFTDFKKGYDQLWLLLDKDKNDDGKLLTVYKDCEITQFNMALSNPCFELWLLIHIVDIQEIPKNVYPFYKGKNNRSKAPKNCEIALRDALGGAYNKANLRIENFLSTTTKAIDRAKALEKLADNIGQKWPITIGSQVYKIVEQFPLS